MQLINPAKQKIIVVTIAALVSFAGLEAAGLALTSYQIADFLKIGFAVYVFLILWQMFMFDIHLRGKNLETLEHSFFRELKRRFAYLKEKLHWLHFKNYLILPGIIFWSTIIILFLNPFDELLKQIWIVVSTLALTKCFWYLKTVFYAHSEASRTVRELIFLTKLYGSYLAYAATFGLMKYLGFNGAWFAVSVFCITFLLLYQAFFQHHFIGIKTLKFLLFMGCLVGVAAYLVYLYWNVNFWSGALVLAAIYNTSWGIIHHQWIDENLTREMVYEYLAVLFVILVIIFSTTNFAERI